MYDIPSGNVLVSGCGIEASAAFLIIQIKRRGKFDHFALNIHRKLRDDDHPLLRKYEAAFLEYKCPTHDDETPSLQDYFTELRQKAEESGELLRMVSNNIERLERILAGKVVLQVPPWTETGSPAIHASHLQPMGKRSSKVKSAPYQPHTQPVSPYEHHPTTSSSLAMIEKTGIAQIATMRQRILVSITPVSAQLHVKITDSIRSLEAMGWHAEACVFLTHEQYQRLGSEEAYYDWLMEQLPHCRMLIAFMGKGKVSARFELDCHSALHHGVHVKLLVPSTLIDSEEVKRCEQMNRWAPKSLRVDCYQDNGQFALFEQLESCITPQAPEDSSSQTLKKAV